MNLSSNFRLKRPNVKLVIPREGSFVTILDRAPIRQRWLPVLNSRSQAWPFTTAHRIQPHVNIAPFTHVCMSCESKRSEASRCHGARDALGATFGDTYPMLPKTRGSNSSVNPRSFTREGSRRRQRTVRVTQPLLRAPLGDSSHFHVNCERGRFRCVFRGAPPHPPVRRLACRSFFSLFFKNRRDQIEIDALDLDSDPQAISVNHRR